MCERTKRWDKQHKYSESVRDSMRSGLCDVRSAMAMPPITMAAAAPAVHGAKGWLALGATNQTRVAVNSAAIEKPHGKHTLRRTRRAKPTTSVDGNTNNSATPSTTNRCRGRRSNGGEGLKPSAETLAIRGRSSTIENSIVTIAANMLTTNTGNTSSHFRAILRRGFIPPKV